MSELIGSLGLDGALFYRPAVMGGPVYCGEMRNAA
jgi:hypothetical protein